MGRKHFIVPTAPSKPSITARLGAGNTTGDNLTDVEVGKIVKLAAESRYNLAAAGDDIEGFITSVELATTDGFTIGGVGAELDFVEVICDGLQATPGTGTLAVGDYVVAGTITAKGTALTTYPKVCKATTPANSVFKWRVVSLPAGSGAVGSKAVIQRVR